MNTNGSRAKKTLSEIRRFDSARAHWKFLNYDKCTSGTNPGVSPSLGITPTPSPTPSLNLNTRPDPCNNTYSAEGVTFTANDTTVLHGGTLPVRSGQAITVRWPDGQTSGGLSALGGLGRPNINLFFPSCNPDGTYHIRLAAKPTEVEDYLRDCMGPDCTGTYGTACPHYVCIDGKTVREYTFYHVAGKSSYEFWCSIGPDKKLFSKATLNVAESSSAGCEANDPATMTARLAGPWMGDRPPYKCQGGGVYADGPFSWADTAAQGSFPKWVGPLCELECLSGRFSSIQVWQLTVSGWSYCKGPEYVAIAEKAPDEDSITFNIGSGTIEIGFHKVCP